MLHPLRHRPLGQPQAGWALRARTRGALGLGKGVPLTLWLTSRARPGALARLVESREERGGCFGSQVIRTPGRPAAPMTDPVWPAAHCSHCYQQLPQSRRLKANPNQGDLKPNPDFCDVCTWSPCSPTTWWFPLRAVLCVGAAERMTSYARVGQRTPTAAPQYYQFY